MQGELHRNNFYQSVELLLLVPMLFLPAIPKCIQIFKENVYYKSYITCNYADYSPCVDCVFIGYNCVFVAVGMIYLLAYIQ